MKKPLVLLLIFFFIVNTSLSSDQTNVISNNPDDDSNIQENLCISLGFNCNVALVLRKFDLRTMAFPFDWNITSLQGLFSLLENDFSDFLNPTYLDKRCFIFNTKYNMAFAHDFPVILQSNGTHTEVSNWMDFLEEIKDNYQRRITRFYNACNLANKVYFFRLKSKDWRFDRYPQDKQSIIKLRDILIDIFPTTNWTLIALDTSPEYQYDWKILRVKNYWVSDYAYFISDDITKNGEWAKIFEDLNLFKS